MITSSSEKTNTKVLPSSVSMCYGFVDFGLFINEVERLSPYWSMIGNSFCRSFHSKNKIEKLVVIFLIKKT